MDIVRRPLLVALTTLLGTALIACGDDTKKDAAGAKPAATLAGDGFSVEMPGKPKRQVLTASTAAGPLPVTAYITEGGDEGYSMSVLKVPKAGRFDLDGAIRARRRTSTAA